jgi:FkbM family methyltransferase
LKRKTNIAVKTFGEKGYSFSVCSDLLEEKEKIIVYSFGIGENLSFSKELNDQYKNCKIYAFDPTPKAIKYVEEYDKSSFGFFEFFPFGLSDKDEIVDFYLPLNVSYVSGSEVMNPGVDKNRVIKVQMHTLKYIMQMLDHTYIDILKLDIEGSEFTAVPQLLEECQNIEQICVEAHHRFYADGDIRLHDMICLLKEYEYHLAEISESEEELLFIKNNFAYDKKE